MKRRKINAGCVSCGKTNLSKNEVGITVKLLGENVGVSQKEGKIANKVPKA